MRRMITTLAATAVFLPTLTHAQQFCAERQAITDKLTSGYGETYAGGGVRNAQSIFEIWKSEEKGTWTILMTMADGRSCVMASGTNWRDPGTMKRPTGVPG